MEGNCLKFVNIDGLTNQNAGHAKAYGIVRYIQIDKPMKSRYLIRAILRENGVQFEEVAPLSHFMQTKVCSLVYILFV